MTEKEEIVSSFANMDTTQHKIRITSPHSILACKYTGIDANNLGFLTLDEFLHKNPGLQNLDKEDQEERYEHNNKRRIKFIENLKKKREEIIKEENENINNMNNKTNYGLFYIKKNNSYNNFNKTNGFNNLKKTKSVAELSLPDINGDKLKNIRKRQKINIRLQIDYQLMQENIRKKNLEKMKMKE